MKGQRRNHEVDERAEESPPQKQEEDEEEEDVCRALSAGDTPSTPPSPR